MRRRSSSRTSSRGRRLDTNSERNEQYVVADTLSHTKGSTCSPPSLSCLSLPLSLLSLCLSTRARLLCAAFLLCFYDSCRPMKCQIICSSPRLPCSSTARHGGTTTMSGTIRTSSNSSFKQQQQKWDNHRDCSSSSQRCLPEAEMTTMETEKREGGESKGQTERGQS